MLQTIDRITIDTDSFDAVMIDAVRSVLQSVGLWALARSVGDALESLDETREKAERADELECELTETRAYVTRIQGSMYQAVADARKNPPDVTTLLDTIMAWADELESA